MKKVIKSVVLIILAIVIIGVLIFVGIYFTRFKSISTIEKLSDYQDGYNLYSMDIEYDYDIQNIIDSGYTDTQGYTDAVIKESLPLLPVHIEVPSFGCSAYRAETTEGDTIMGRNYDFKLNTSCMMVRCHPKDGYKSICFAALDNIGADDAFSGISTKMACLATPFCCLDGVNEKGVSVAILTLDSDPTDQNTGREKMTHSLAVRLILDKAATTQEAIDLISKYDIYAANGRDYHLFVSDASGDSAVIENDPEVPERTTTATRIQAITNFYGMYIDKVVSKQKNGIYGHGKERYDYMMEVIEPNNGILDADSSWQALKNAATEPNPESVTSNTQWSIIFNNTKGTADICIRRNWDDMHSFSIN